MTLTEAEREALYSPIGNDEAYPELPGVVEAIIAARLAPALALADQWEARAMLSYHRVTWEHAQALRAALGVSAPTGDDAR
jgi:hypothetical protein